MGISAYSNFDLEISSVGENGRFRVRVLNSPEGESEFVETQWPFSASEESDLVREIRGNAAVRRGIPIEQKRVQEFGGRLFKAVFTNEIEQLYRTSLGKLKHSEGLRLRLRLSERASAHSTPWEFLFDERTSEFLVVQERTPIVRYLAVSHRVQPLSVVAPLRILVAMSAPIDQPRLNVVREWEMLNEALASSIKAGQIALRRVEGRCTFDSLRDALRSEETHVFHFIGHGVPGALILERESGESVEMDVVRLRAAFPGGSLPRLVVLNACAGAVHEDDAVFSGVAQSFLRQGVPATLGMQASITDKAAILLARYFYRELATGAAVDAALTEARLRLQGNGNLVEWGTPVLYMRAPDGRLFANSDNTVEEGQTVGGTSPVHFPKQQNTGVVLDQASTATPIPPANDASPRPVSKVTPKASNLPNVIGATEGDAKETQSLGVSAQKVAASTTATSSSELAVNLPSQQFKLGGAIDSLEKAARASSSSDANHRSQFLLSVAKIAPFFLAAGTLVWWFVSTNQTSPDVAPPKTAAPGPAQASPQAGASAPAQAPPPPPVDTSDLDRKIEVQRKLNDALKKQLLSK